MSLVAPALLAFTLAAVPRGAAPGPSPSAALAPSAAFGRLVLRDGSAALSPRDARRTLGSGPLALHLRSGWSEATARLDDDGFFVVEGEPGDWVIESLTVGNRVEFVDPPLVLHLRRGEVACAGRVEVAFRELGELGKGSGSATASDGCAELASRANAVAAGRTVRARVAEPMAPPVPRSAWEIPTALRADFGWRVGNGQNAPTESSLGATIIVGINRPVGAPGAVAISASLAQVDVSGAEGRRVAGAGLSYGLGSLVELMGGFEAKISGAGGGSGVFGQFRLGTEAFGLSLRGALQNHGTALILGVDLAPLWLVGALL